MARGKFIRDAIRELREFANSLAPQRGMFSTLDELIQEAPFDQAPVEQWRGYLKPGRMLIRGQGQFPLKQEEIDYGLGNFDLGLEGPVTKEQLLQHLRANRPTFELAIGDHHIDDAYLTHQQRQALHSSGERIPLTTRTMNRLDRSRETLSDYTDPDADRFTASQPIYGPDSPEYVRLSHQSKDMAGYQESATRLRGLHFPSHFDPSTLSWARTTTHGTGGAPQVRLVEEIQSDLHQTARKRVPLYSKDETIRYLTPEEAAEYNRIVGDDEATVYHPRITELHKLAKSRAPRRGYRSREEEARLEELSKRSLSPSGGLTAEEGDFIDEVAKKAPDAPFKDPAEYGALELRKQLLTAAREEDDYLALARGSDQIERYSLSGDEAAGTSHVYDKVYRKELEKLARRYGAEVEEVTIPGIVQDVDWRPPIMQVGDYESVDDFVDDLIEELIDGYQTGDDVRSMFSDLRRVTNQLAEADDDVVLMSAERHKQAMSQLDDMLDRAVRTFEEGTDDFRAEELSNWTRKFLHPLEQLRVAHHRDLARAAGEKTFPAIKLTPEVRERIKNEGVPLWALSPLAVPPEEEAAEREGFAKGGVVSRVRDSDLMRELRRRALQLYRELDHADKQAVVDWTEGYAHGNSEESRVAYDRLANLIERAPRTHTEFDVYRGDSTPLGTRATFPSPIPTSLDIGVAREYAHQNVDAGGKSHLMQITVPEDSPALFVGPWGFGTYANSYADELEVLLPRHSKFELLRRDPPEAEETRQRMAKLKELNDEYWSLVSDRDANVDELRELSERISELGGWLEEYRAPDLEYKMLKKARGGVVDMARGGSLKDAIKKLRETYDRMYRELDWRDQKLLRDWTFDAELDDYGRFEKPALSRLNELIDVGPRLPIDLRVFRGGDDPPTVRAKGVAPMSTSLEADTAESFGDVYSIELPQGGRGMYLGTFSETPSEHEVLLRSGSKFSRIAPPRESADVFSAADVKRYKSLLNELRDLTARFRVPEDRWTSDLLAELKRAEQRVKKIKVGEPDPAYGVDIEDYFRMKKRRGGAVRQPEHGHEPEDRSRYEEERDFLKGLLGHLKAEARAQLGAVDPETGELRLFTGTPEQDIMRPGVVDDLASLPAAFGIPLEASERALERMDERRRLARELEGVGEPSHPAEHAASMLGLMLSGQLPVGGSRVASGVLSRVATSPVEFFAPVVRPRHSAGYAAGTGFGTVMGEVLDEDAPRQLAGDRLDGERIDMMNRILRRYLDAQQD